MSTENTPLFFLAFVFLSLHEGIQADGVSQFSLTSPSMGNYSCPGNNITYTCVFCTSNTIGVTTVWSGSTFQCATNQIVLNQKVSGAVQPFTPMSCGSLSAVTTSNASTCYTSVLTIPAVQAALNGATVQCADGGSPTIVGTDTLKIISPPGAPNGMAKTIGPDMVLVVVNPSSSGGLPTSYNVTISNSSYVYTKSTPAGLAMVTFTGTELTNSTIYNVSAVAINCAGSSNPTTISISWMYICPTSTVSVTSTVTVTTPATTFPQAMCVPSIDVSTVVGITFSITFIMAFSLGVLVTICICCISKTRSKTTSPHPSTRNAPYEVVSINQKKIDVIPLESNDAYGTVK